MSEACRHTGLPEWTGPTPEDVVKARGRSSVLIGFRRADTGEEIYVRILSASMSIIWPHATFTGRCTDGRPIENGIICAHGSHSSRIHIELQHLPLLTLVADTG